MAERQGTRASALVDAIREDIAAGLLKAGDRLPPQRQLADALGLAPQTVMRAYAEATRRGYVRGEVGRGTYVCPSGNQVSQHGEATLSRSEQGPIDFSQNLPLPGESAQALVETLADLARAGGCSDYLDHQQTDAGLRHRQAAANWISTLGLRADAQNVVLTNGAQQGIFAALLALLRPGDVLLTEAMTYAPLPMLAQHLGVRLVGLPMDEEGIVPDALESACRQYKPKALYLTPTLQTPTTATMGEDRRKRIACAAQTHDLVIVEDDVFGFLPPARPLPLAAFASERTIFVTSLSKSVAPGLRVGFVLAPNERISAVRSAVNLSSWMPPPLMMEIAARWIEGGVASALNASQRVHAARRQSIARNALEGLDYRADPHGLHLWVSLPDHWEADTFVAEAEHKGVLLRPARAFLTLGTRAPSAVRLSLSHEASDARAAHGLRVISDLIKTSARDDFVV
ncbi:PLP-dependent aminotransferase family protein [Sphingomonas oleivorans]|uniref:aminotransferase-like domain-containing protein n=1 Tax=Sphingomonas oleivorans TaxID=1735121 RepID=UPI0013FDC5C6|nr:PLP-dependent aminotransferase family protein [Sphingomonas oleivorans]